MMTASDLPDSTARKRAACDLSTTLLVEAAAGTGKTTLLVRRVLNILQQMQVSLSQIVAITFTEKAAGELKVKLRHALEKVVSGKDDEIILDNESEPRFRRALLELDNMPVGTIHGFCRDLIGQRPVEAGVEPGFSVADEQTALRLRDEAWEQWMTRELSYDNPVVRPLLECGIPVTSKGNESSLRSLFNCLVQHRDTLAAIRVDAPSEPQLQERVSRFRDDLRRDLEVLKACRDPSDLLAVELFKIEHWLTQFKGNSARSLRDWLAQAPKLTSRGGRKGLWKSEEAFDHAGLLRRNFADRVKPLHRALFSYWCAALVPKIKQAVEHYQILKRERSLLDFDDLLIVARDLLKNHPDVREQFKLQFAYVLVDEFQDTDPLQAEIVFFLCERAGHCAAEWDQVALDPGKLFIVGDPKQSIYRFRRADLDLYGKTKALIQNSGVLGEGDCLVINVNFRSRPDILDEVNAIFAPWMTGPTATRYEPEYVPLRASKSDDGESSRTVFIAPPSSRNEGWSADEAASAEAAAIAEYILQLTTPGDGTAPPRFAFRDLAILYPTITHLGELETALRSRGIPFHVARGRSFTTRAETQALITVLAALDNPYDEISVVGALRSPFFACSDEELLRHRLHHGDFVYLNEIPDSPLAESFSILRRLHELRNRQTASQVVMSLFEQTSGLEIFALKPQGESRVANLLKVLDLARALDSDANSSFHELVQTLQEMEQIAQEDDSPATERGDDIVQLTTIHKAKGLEFKVAILYRIGDRPKNKGEPILQRETQCLEWRTSNWETSGFAAAFEEEQDREKCEAHRLLYVAFTRAEELLVVPAYWTSKGKSSGDLLHEMLQLRCPNVNGIPQTSGTAWTVFPTDGLDLTSRPRETIPIRLDDLPDEASVSAARHRRSSWESELQRTVQTLNHRHHFLVPSDHSWSSPIPGTELEEAPHRDGKSLGDLVHRILQHVDFSTGEDLELLAKYFGESLSLAPEVVAEAVLLARRALESPLIARARQSDRYFRELRFSAMLDGQLCEGSMDLVFIENRRSFIVDYKTDKVSPDDVPTRAAVYQNQAIAYARSLQTIFQGKKPTVLLFFLRPNIVFKTPTTLPLS